MVLTASLPAGLTFVSAQADRGPGCSGGATVTCSLDFVSSGQVANVVIVAVVGAAGDLVATAAVRSEQGDANASDNQSSFRISVPAPPPTGGVKGTTKARAGAPALARAGAVSTTRAAGVAVVRARVSVGTRARVTVSAQPLVLLAGSRIGSGVLRTSRPVVTTQLKRAQVVLVDLRLPASRLKRGRTYRVRLAATSADGRTSTLVIPFRLR